MAGAERRAFAKWASRYRDIGKLQYNPLLLLPLSNSITGAIFLGGTLLLYFYAAKSGVTQSDFIAFNAAYGLVTSSLTSLVGVVMALSTVKPHLEMVQPILEAMPEHDPGKRQVVDLSGQIEVSNLSFSNSKE